MRNLTSVELNTISGGFTATDLAVFENVKKQAFYEGATWAAIGSGFTMAATLALTENNPVITLLAGGFVLPYAFGLGYMNSSAWNLFQSNVV